MNAAIDRTETDAEIFARCKRTAAIGDLQFVLRIAETRLTEFEFTPATVAILGEMVAMEEQLTGIVGTPALQKAVGALVMRYRQSIRDYTLKGFPPLYSRRRERRRWVGHRSAVPQRVTRLTLDEARALIAATRVDVVDVAPPKRVAKPKPLGMMCPRCVVALVATEHAHLFDCAKCKATWGLTIAADPAAVARRPRLVTSDGTRTSCSKCGAQKPAEEFGTRTDCRDCRRAYREQRKTA